jgi:maleylacetate reductase
VSDFELREAERRIVFGVGASARTGELIEPGYVLLTTARAIGQAPGLREPAAGVIEVGEGLVERVAGELRGEVGGKRLVALGGGRVIDVAKALAAAGGGGRVAAVPTSLSGAEMTGVHRHAEGVAPDTPRVRPVLVINDPELSASQPDDALAASGANAAGHALMAAVSERANPLSAAGGAVAIERMAAGWSGPGPDREALALGSLLAGWAIDLSGLGPHHALAQTAVRGAGLAHAEANAALLLPSVSLADSRVPERLAELERRSGVDMAALAADLRRRAGIGELEGLRDAETLDRLVDAVAARRELELLPPAADRAELREIYLAAAG